MDHEVIGDWELLITGEIVRVEKDDIDKSGRNPKFMITFFVQGESSGVPEGAVVASPTPVRIKDLELARMTKVELGVGSRVSFSARASGPRPTSFYLSRIVSS